MHVQVLVEITLGTMQYSRPYFAIIYFFAVSHVTPVDADMEMHEAFPFSRIAAVGADVNVYETRSGFA